MHCRAHFKVRFTKLTRSTLLEAMSHDKSTINRAFSGLVEGRGKDRQRGRGAGREKRERGREREREGGEGEKFSSHSNGN